MALLIIICILILLLSFLASSMEAALFSVTPLRIEQMCEKKLPGSHRLKINKEKIRDSIIAIVILNNISNIAGSIFVGTIAAHVFDDFWIGIFSTILTFSIILLGEVIPKTIGEHHAETYARRTANFVYILRIILKPIIILTKAFLKPVGGSTDSRDRISDEEITLLASIGHRYGDILEDENQLIRQVFKLNDILARDIMTPRTVVFALQADQQLTKVAPEIYEASVSRIPIYGEDLDDIVGIVHIRDLLAALAKGHGEKTLRIFGEKVLFIPDNARVNILLKTFQKNREHLGIVIDEYGGMAGVLSLEDILEQLVGEIVDEYDKDVDMRAKARMLSERKSRR